MLGRTSPFLSALALTFALAAPAYAQQSPTGTWAAEGAGDNFYYGGSCTDGTYLYITAGYQGVGSTTAEVYGRFRRYDPAANSWITMPPIQSGTATGSTVWGYQYPAPAVYYSASGVSRIFLFGGYGLFGTIGSTTYTSSITNQIRVFTFSSATTGTWTTHSSVLSIATYYNAATLLNDKIYVMGGATTANLDIFDPVTNTISAGTAMPGYLYYHGATSVPALGKVYVMGGYGVAGYTGINYEYTPQDTDGSTNDTGGTWTTRAQISNGSNVVQPLYLGVQLITLNNRIYVIGYNSTSGIQNQSFEYNPINNTWAQRATLTYGRYYWPAWVAINGKGYAYGGGASPTTGEEFTPPDFGLPPDEPTGLGQVGSRAETSLQALPDQNQFDGWTNTQVTFTANVTDPNTTQQVRFRVQVKPQAAAWTTASAITSLDTGLTAQGALAINYTTPSGGGYDWRWRVEDTYNNSYPLAANTWVEAFGTMAAPNTNSPDFRSDQIPPADPVAISPNGNDIGVNSPTVGPVVLNWIESTDNGPVAGISYELQVGNAGFINIEAQLFSSAGTDSYPIDLSVSPETKHWRIRARDVGGNFSAWSPPLEFRVVYDDRINHSSGDAKKVCGFSAFGSPALGNALLGLAVLAMAAGRRMIRKS